MKKLPNEFQFVLSHEKFTSMGVVEDIGDDVYTAILNSKTENYEISWNNKHGATYSVEDTNKNVTEGWWIVNV